MTQSICSIPPFEALLPRLTRVLGRRCPRRDPAYREEWVAEAIALAFQIWCSARLRHRHFSVDSLAHYAGLLVGSGRKLAGSFRARRCLL